jgi:thymidylate kinase
MTQGIDFDHLYNMHNYGDQGSLIPDLTIIFDIPAEVAFE